MAGRQGGGVVRVRAVVRWQVVRRVSARAVRDTRARGSLTPRFLFATKRHRRDVAIRQM